MSGKDIVNIRVEVELNRKGSFFNALCLVLEQFDVEIDTSSSMVRFHSDHWDKPVCAWEITRVSDYYNFKGMLEDD